MYVPISTLIIDCAEDFEISSEYSCSCSLCGPDCACVARYNSLGTGPWFECNQHCACKVCCNRSVQAGVRYKLAVLKAGAKGLGVFAQDFIPAKSYVGEYAGVVADKETSGEYVFQLKENTPNRTIVTTVNAEYYGNYTRYFNHSCEPNLDVKAIRINYIILHNNIPSHCIRPAWAKRSNIIPHIAFFAIKDIQANEELTFKYREQDLNKPCLCATSACKGRY
jgi:SET domain-containing protein